MKQKYLAKTPSDLHDLWPQIAGAESTEVHLMLQLYTILGNAEVKDTDEEVDETIGPRVLEPLYAEWARGIKDANLSQRHHAAPVTKWRFVLDITRPPLHKPNARLWEAYEARGLARITTVLRSTFRDHGTLEASIAGAPCWCLLAESEKHVMLPKGKNWPLQRKSHVQNGEPATSQARTCLRLAQEHWDDEHWSAE